MQWSRFFRLTRHLRAADRDEFLSYLSALNTQRTVIVGLILLAFAVFWISLNLAGLDNSPLWLYNAFLLTLLAGLGLIAVRAGRKRDRLKRMGETLVLATAISWMFFAIHAQAHVNHGLVEFIIGTLALTMLRPMTPGHSGALLFGLVLAYAGVLWSRDLLSLYALNNGVLFTLFSFVLAVGHYNNRILEFRNRRILQRMNRQNRRLTTWAMQDALTHLPNRRYLDQLLDHHWSDDALRQQNLSLILLDIDHFKAFNDQHGHPEGDRCLQAVARQLEATIRHEGTCARLGGEEFAVILPQTDEAAAARIAERLRQVLAEHTAITASFGIASTRPDQHSAESFYISADQALYQAKRKGRNRVVRAGA